MTALIGALSCAFSFSACGFQEKKVSAEELSAKYARQATDGGEVNDAFKSAMANFSVSLLQKTITKDGNNDLTSPLSAAQCLALIANGANGETLAQLENLFGLPIDEFNRASYAYVSSLYSGDDCEVNLANSIWIKENSVNVLPEFLQTNADWYGAQAYLAPFDSTTLTDINNWCYNKTKGKIDKILDNVPSDAVMYLINALDFDAKWNVKYEKSDVQDRAFYNDGGSSSTVKMMYSDEHIYLEDGEKAVGFTRPYKGDRYSFVGILPNEGVDIYDYVENFSGERWNAMWEGRSRRTVKAGLPEFTYKTDMLLNEALQALGVTDMFDRGLADFSNMSDVGLYCDFVKQKTFIDVSRNGTKAAAITMGGMKDTAIAPEQEVRIILDRPFLYAIVDNANGLPLFIGVVGNL